MNTYDEIVEGSNSQLKLENADENSSGTVFIQNEDDEILELGEDFDFDGFQVVRREFFAHTREPACSFNNCKFYVNAACLARFPTSDYAQVLINRQKKILALRPCPEEARDSFQWCSESKGKRKPKQITCKLFYAKIVALMEWNPNHRYKLLGKVIHSNDEYLLAFDLTATEVYQRTTPDGEKPKTSRIPVFPAAWQDQFGLPYNEHKQSMQINVVDGYAVYSIKGESTEQDQKNELSDVDMPDENVVQALMEQANAGGGQPWNR